MRKHEGAQYGFWEFLFTTVEFLFGWGKEEEWEEVEGKGGGGGGLMADRGLKMHVFLSDNSEAVRKWANSDG